MREGMCVCVGGGGVVFLETVFLFIRERVCVFVLLVCVCVWMASLPNRRRLRSSFGASLRSTYIPVP